MTPKLYPSDFVGGLIDLIWIQTDFFNTYTQKFRNGLISVYSSVWSMLEYSYNHILCSCTMQNDLPLIGFDQSLHSNVIMTSVFFNNLRLA